MPNKKTEKLRVIPLGGVNGIGKNITVFEYGADMIVVDCGLAFPEDNMLGVDLVIPDMSYIESNKDKLRGLFITHGHEDHIGAVPYFLKKFDVPVYGTRLTLGIIEGKFEEHDISGADLVEVKAGQTIKAGAFSVEFIKVNHSIADACALCITTPVGRVVHTGDFKIDLTPLNGEPIDFTYLEYALLAFLVTHPGRTYSRDALLRRVWGFDYFGGSRTVDVHVRRVRAKLGPELSQHLETVRGVGYLWD